MDLETEVHNPHSIQEPISLKPDVGGCVKGTHLLLSRWKLMGVAECA